MNKRVFIVLLFIFFGCSDPAIEDYFAEEVVPEETQELIPAGEFMMGCNEAIDNECQSDEKPSHKVFLDAYYIDKYEVTVAQYRECVNAGICTNPDTVLKCNWNVSGRENHPINCVDWYQAKAYCQWVGKRLPTEAEWEKASRGTDGRIYPWGNEWDCYKSCNSVPPCSNSFTCPIGSHPDGKSPYEVMDMGGNIGEWVADWYDNAYYGYSPLDNPQGPSSGSESGVRGGSWWDDFPLALRASVRARMPPAARTWVIGLRCVSPYK